MSHTCPHARYPTLSMLVGGGIALTVTLLTRLWVGSPLNLIHTLEAFLTIPPLWIMGVLWLTSFALLGAAAGALLAAPCGNPEREVHLWRGSTFMVLAMVSSLVWYALLFGKQLLLPSCLCLLPALSASLLCALSWKRIHLLAAIPPLLFGLWQFTLLLLQISVLFHI